MYLKSKVFIFLRKLFIKILKNFAYQKEKKNKAYDIA